MKKMCFVIAIISALSLFNVTSALSAVTFYKPNVLIILDRSGSMAKNPAETATGTWCASSPTDIWGSGCANESKISIAARVIANLLDANNNQTVDATDDEGILGVRLGYGEYISGTVAIPYNSNGIGTSYSTIFSDATRSNTGGLTPLAQSLVDAKTYLLSSSIAGEACYVDGCRKSYVIVITDGEDTNSCSVNDVQRRRATVYAAKALYDAGIKVFVVGFGSLPDASKYTLNWTAYYGYGGNDPYTAIPAGDNSGAGTYTNIGTFCDTVTGTANDPGAQAKLGYAFLASNATDLAASIKAAIELARAGSYTRSQPVLTARGNSIYSGFFDLPGWKGHLDAWNVDSNPLSPTYGDILTSPSNPPCTSTGTNALYELYDAGATLTNSGCTGYVAPSARTIYTAVGSPILSRIYFNISGTNTSAQQIDLCTALIKTTGSCTATEATTSSATLGSSNELIDFIRFNRTTYNGSSGTRDATWKLGDIWHSTPTIVGPPVGSFSSAGYNAFKSSKSTRPNVLIVGANDGMLHAFDDSNNGKELWSFIPNNLLGKLKNLIAGHAFYVDASPTAADVCLNTNNCGKSAEAAADWKTVVITGERGGGNAYFALDITDTTNPSYLWQFTDANLGYTWSKPAIGKVRVKNGGAYEDHWVTFFGGGTSTTNDVGNRFYAVDIGTGDLLGTGTNKTEYTIEGVTNKVPGAPTAVDSNGDFYVDAVFFGDADGRLWKLKTTDPAPNSSNWPAGKIFNPALLHKTISCPDGTVTNHSTGFNGLRPIYYRPAIVFDSNLKPLIMFGTGFADDNIEPGSTVQNYFYIVRLESSAYSGILSPNEYITELLAVTLDVGESVVGAPVVYDGKVWYVTYTPPSTTACCTAGTGKLRWAELKTCGATGVVDLGSGIPQGPVIGPNGIYTNTSTSPKPTKCTTCPSGPGNLSDVIYWRER